MVINEFMAAGQDVLADEDSEYPDWIELHNRGSRPVNLLGWSLSDDPAEPDKWMLPQIDLPPDSYLVVFASGKNRPRSTGSPKDIPAQRLSPPAALHTNFKLASGGGFLALYDNTSRRFLDAVAYNYGPQMEDVAFGRCAASTSGCYLTAPTPGLPNDESGAWRGLVAPVTASVPRGFYDAPVEVGLSTTTPDAAIWYTTDGSQPAEGQGQLYGGLLTIADTATLRAVAVKPAYLASPAAAYSYVFPEQVLHQPAESAGYPATWGMERPALVGYTAEEPVPADYGMDPEIVDDPVYGSDVRDSLLALPSLMLATDVENLDIYFEDPLARGIESERPVSVEWIDPANPSAGFQTEAGLRLQGHLGRSELVKKHSLRLVFRKLYGPGELDFDLFPNSSVGSFDTLVLRAGNNESYAGHPGSRTRLATYAKDEWLRRSQLAMSGFGAHGRFVHLYLNGLYWGVYDLVERPNASFAASYFGGDEDQWVSAKAGSVDEGLFCRLDSMRSLAEMGGMADPARYSAMQEYIDPVQFSDYVITHWYAGADDWPENNWYLGMRQPAGQFLFFVWDGELTWMHGADVQLGVDAKQDRLVPNIVKPVFNALIQNDDFRVTFADRLFKHTSPGGVLSDAQAEARWMEITGEVEEAIPAESARWGDALFDTPVTVDDWRQARDWVADQMQGNADKLIEQARAQGYYPVIDPPVFSQESGSFDDRTPLTLDAPQGDIYYTLDGSDPRVAVTGAVNPAAIRYSGPIELGDSTVVRARVLSDGSWSAMNEATLVDASQPSGLRFTEVMYNPADGDDYEFLELTNVGSLGVDLSGAAFEGIDLRFDRPTWLAGGESMVLAADADAFSRRYPGVPVAAVYGGELSDRGETITLRNATGQTLASMSYDDENGWPLTADGDGDSLVLLDPASDMNDPRSWRASADINGMPGAGDMIKTVYVAPAPAAVLPAFDASKVEPANSVDVRFGDDMLLAGYDLWLNGQPLSPENLPAVKPGDLLEYTLYWQRGRLADKDLRGFVQLVTPNQHVVAQDDHPAGLVLRPANDCFTAELAPDRYALRVPADATNGLVRPVVGGYDPATSERFSVFAGDGAQLDDQYALAPLKIVGDANAPTPQHQLAGRFDADIELLGYSLDPASAGVRPGDSLTVTMLFRSESPIEEDLVRFVQVHSPQSGMAAQLDSQPAGGDNPTRAWKAGEVVVDQVVLAVSPEAAPGSYRLLLGFYQPATGERLDVQDEAGNAAPDQALVLGEVTVLPVGNAERP
ncbi:MAG: lamin tail domain-containing protein [Caldilineales bacterium]